MRALIVDTGPPLAGGPRLPGKSRGTGHKFAGCRGERVTQSYPLPSNQASQKAGGWPCPL
jgi:hypothetical protein